MLIPVVATGSSLFFDRDKVMAVQHFSIGELSKRTGVNIETIRYYEKIDAMPEPPRTRGGHRSYGAEHARRLLFISRSRSLGFSLEEIRSLLGIADGHDITCADVRELTLHHAEEARRKIADLRKLERTLRDMAAQCHGDRIPDCPIVDALFG
jgi:MerR family mercuric resistance operon transcriptional regulator